MTLTMFVGVVTPCCGVGNRVPQLPRTVRVFYPLPHIFDIIVVLMSQFASVRINEIWASTYTYSEDVQF